MGIFDALRGLCSRSKSSSNPAAQGEWEIGPWINGVSRSKGMPRYMAKMPDGTHQFVFPASEPGVHYVYRATGPLPLGGKLVLRFAITGNGEFVPAARDDALPCDLQLYIERKGNDWQAKTPWERWYSVEARELTFREHIFEVPLVWDKWEGVVGHMQSEAEFKAALSEPINVGFTFSGAKFAGHGVWLKAGNASFVLRSLEIVP